MTNRIAATNLLSGPTLRRRIALSADAGWRLRRIRRGWLSMPLPTIEEVEERMRNYRGLFARLTPEARAAIEAYDGPEVLGPANGPRRTF